MTIEQKIEGLQDGKELLLFLQEKDWPLERVTRALAAIGITQNEADETACLTQNG